jgi:NAD-dependent deacetylase
MEYATLDCFMRDPAKSWRLFRALGRNLRGKVPNPAHHALADLERGGLLTGVITQNVDGLHQAAGSVRVLEMHGDASRIHCPRCGHRAPLPDGVLEDGPVPVCPKCGSPTKPDVVLFEESVRRADEVQRLLVGCDLLLLVGTSADVWPASAIPEQLMAKGARVVEFNVEETRLTSSIRSHRGIHVRGQVSRTLPAVAEAALRTGGGTV